MNQCYFLVIATVLYKMVLRLFKGQYKIQNYKTFFLYAGNLKPKEIPPAPERPALIYASEFKREVFVTAPVLDAPSYLSDDEEHIIYETGEIVPLPLARANPPDPDGESITKKFTWWEQFVAKRFFNS